MTKAAADEEGKENVQGDVNILPNATARVEAALI